MKTTPRNIGFLRQWLNEDRITDPKKMVSNKDLEHWLFLGEGVEESLPKKEPRGAFNRRDDFLYGDDSPKIEKLKLPLGGPAENWIYEMAPQIEAKLSEIIDAINVLRANTVK